MERCWSKGTPEDFASAVQAVPLGYYNSQRVVGNCCFKAGDAWLPVATRIIIKWAAGCNVIEQFILITEMN